VPEHVVGPAGVDVVVTEVGVVVGVVVVLLVGVEVARETHELY
jgi:hypothetical protein